MSEKESIKEINNKMEVEGQNYYDEVWKMEIIEYKASEFKRIFYQNVRRSAF